MLTALQNGQVGVWFHAERCRGGGGGGGGCNGWLNFCRCLYRSSVQGSLEGVIQCHEGCISSHEEAEVWQVRSPCSPAHSTHPSLCVSCFTFRIVMTSSPSGLYGNFGQANYSSGTVCLDSGSLAYSLMAGVLLTADSSLLLPWTFVN